MSGVTTPEAVAVHALLVLPAGARLVPLATAWFPSARWVRRASGAGSGELRLTQGWALRGPECVDGQAHSLPSAADRYLLCAVPDVRGAAPAELVVDWSLAVARRSGGVVLHPDGTPRADTGADSDADADRPDEPALTLWSPVLLEPPLTADLARSVLPRAATTALATPEGGGSSPGWRLDLGYAGGAGVHLRLSRPDRLPTVLATLAWRDHGPFAYRVTWDRPDLAAEAARLVRALVRAATGTVVDHDGFAVLALELASRAEAVA